LIRGRLRSLHRERFAFVDLAANSNLRYVRQRLTPLR
jgi:hypothetical protein